MKYRILSFDGGGICGTLTAALLGRLWPAIGSADCYAGTSTGGLIALLLAAGKTPDDVLTMYEQSGPLIFERSLWRRMGFGVTKALYDNTNLHNCVVNLFGDMRLSDLSADIAIPATHALCGTPVLFTRQVDEAVAEVAMMTTAAPVYFPSYKGFVDGGLSANNPSAAAICAGPNGDDGTVCLSLGTGAWPHHFANGGDWGALDWVVPLIRIQLEANNALAVQEAARLLGDRYFRLNPTCPSPEIEMDDVSQIPQLKALGQQADISEVQAWLQAKW